MESDTTVELCITGLTTRKPISRKDVIIDQSSCKLTSEQIINLIRMYRTRMWQFRECGGMYWHMAEAIKCYGILKVNGIEFPQIHRQIVRKEVSNG